MSGSISEIRAILFDKDGTLIDFNKSWGPVLREAATLAAEGDAALARRLMLAGGMDPETLVTAADTVFAAGNTREIAEVFRAEGSNWPLADLVERLDEVFVAAADRGVPVIPLQPLFRALSLAGFRLGLASSDSEAAIRRLLAREGIAAFVDFVAGYDSGFGTKPEPGMALAFAQALGVAPRQVAVIGDNRHDMRMARSAGCGLRIAVLSGTGTRATLAPEADRILASIAELPALFLAQRPA